MKWLLKVRVRQLYIHHKLRWGTWQSWKYNRRRRRWELLGNVVFAAVASWGGDYVLQKHCEDDEQFNKRRSCAFLIWGAIGGAWGHVWYNTMAKVPYMVKHPVRQVALYQTLFLPLEYVSFYAVTGVVEGETLDTVKEELRNKFAVTLLSDLVLYSPVMILILKFLPVHLRTVAENSFTFLWGVFLSFLKHHDFDPSHWWRTTNDYTREKGWVDYTRWLGKFSKSAGLKCSAEESRAECWFLQ